MARYLCPVCGFSELSEQPPWADGEGSSRPGCRRGPHLGYDDAAGGDAGRRERVWVALRQRWIAAVTAGFCRGLA